MRKSSFIIMTAVLAVMMFISCAPSMKISSSWMNQESLGTNKYDKIFLFAMTGNMELKQTVENAQADAANEKGVSTVKSSDVFPPGFFKNDPGKDAVIQKIKETGCDAVFTSAIVKSTSETRYVPGSTTYMPYPAYGHYGSFGGYYGYHSAMVYNPGYVTEDKTYFIESNLYDVQTGEIIWSVQSKASNPGNLKSLSRTYAALLLERLKMDGGLYRKK